MRLQRGSLWLTGFVLLIALLAGACSSGSSGGGSTAPPAKELDSGNIGVGAQYSHQFTKAGTFPYHCTIHAPMTGTIVVSDTAAVSTNQAISIVSSVSPFPGIPMIKTGTTVTWTNNSGATHTVTSN